MIKLYKYQTDWFTDGRSEPIALKGPISFITKYISKDELENAFGGYAIWNSINKNNEKFIGVWGKRNCSKLLRLLKEKGGEFELINNEGSKHSLSIQVVVKGG